jgi:release factor glutamine methyltransferase
VTIGEALRDAAVRLEPVGGTGRLDAVFLLAHAGGVSRQEMIAHRERELTPDVVERLETLVARRELGEPLAYVTGEAGFFGRMFGVDRRVLVPRPETELAVEWALRHLRAIGREKGSAADVGTGSGAIAVTLACELPDLTVWASDVSAEALAVARRNAARNAVFQHVTFLPGDLAEPLLPYAPFDCVVANLPYVPTAEVAAAPDPVSFEPLLARDGGHDGLDLYRRFVPALGALVAPRGIAILEAGPQNARALEEIVRDALPRAGVETIRDYADLERFVVAVVPP